MVLIISDVSFFVTCFLLDPETFGPRRSFRCCSITFERYSSSLRFPGYNGAVSDVNDALSRRARLDLRKWDGRDYLHHTVPPWASCVHRLRPSVSKSFRFDFQSSGV
eukprot:s295_g33.t1